MSKHLMLPLEIDGTKYCLTDNGRRTTVGIATEILTTSPELVDVTVDPWNLLVMPIGDQAAETEISFGVSCATQILLYFEISDTGGDASATIQPYLNGVSYGSPAELDEGDSPIEDFPINLSDLPCGNVITLLCTVDRMDDSEILYVSTRIDGIS